MEWQTASELDVLGFNLYRSERAEGPYVQLNEGLIPSQLPDGPGGASYAWHDAGASLGRRYFYLLEEIDSYGGATRYGPTETTWVCVVYLPQVVKGR